MGQKSSVLGATFSEKFTQTEVNRLFRARATSLLTTTQLATVSAKVNSRDASVSDSVLTHGDLAHLLQLNPESPNESEAIAPQGVSDAHSTSSVDQAVVCLYQSFVVLGRLPFLQKGADGQLTIQGLIASLVVHSGQLPRIWPDCDYLKLFAASLALASQTSAGDGDAEKGNFAEHRSSNEPSASPDPEKPRRKHKVDMVRARSDDANLNCRGIKWETLSSLSTYDGLEFDILAIPAYGLVMVLALLLLINSVPVQPHKKMQSEVARLVAHKWASFETNALSLVRYISVDITEHNWKTASIPYGVFREAVERTMPGFFQASFRKLLDYSVFSVASVGTDDGTNETSSPRRKTYIFEPSRLVDEATISTLSIFLSNIDSGIEISKDNLVELYNGSHSGFSIRSLESKIFKWQAPTVFLVAGKRLRAKTATTNKRYQQFDSEFPRFFRSNESPRKSWQKDTDKVVYAVFVSQPWKNSNKYNFGDESSAIVSLSPRYDVFPSKSGTVTGGKSIYFNNLGMGVGFGNEQPINKNSTRKYVPGSVSLTIEANLEFAVFRHIYNAGANTPHYFQPSEQSDTARQDYEDRFVITDLEVWGVGSTKELDEQRKQWEWEEKQAQARQSVNLRNLDEDRAFLEMVGLVGNHGAGGSV